MNNITILSSWGVRPSPATGFPDLNYPNVALDHDVPKWEDITGQPVENLTPDPNTYVVRAWVDDATLTAIEADPKYTVVTVEEA